MDDNEKCGARTKINETHFIRTDKKKVYIVHIWDTYDRHIDDVP